MKAKRTITAERALTRAAALCVVCEQAESDIRRKLLSWGLPSAETDEVIQCLIDEQFLDEKRFASAFVHDKFHFEGWGRIKIAYQLRTKAISSEIIDNALTLIDEEEYFDKLKHILSNKMFMLSSKEPLQAKASLVRFALSRGFEPNLIYKCLPLISNDDDDDDEYFD
jgi:regulatory protein